MNRDAAYDLVCEYTESDAMVRPSGLLGMKSKSVVKKMKQKGFAAAVNRDDLHRGAADLGVDLKEHIQFVIDALECHAEELALTRNDA